jgi:hypothetical protein
MESLTLERARVGIMVAAAIGTNLAMLAAGVDSIASRALGSLAGFAVAGGVLVAVERYRAKP